MDKVVGICEMPLARGASGIWVWDGYIITILYAMLGNGSRVNLLGGSISSNMLRISRRFDKS